ncbi:LemA family protein [Mycoplasma sp. CSL10137]|uniref:LemA family protein n=1 Tax=unclassified Mycoplasma TaxID=2683645 RepID=UPI00197C47DA|nr:MULTISPECIES: LemA family protein [unclassified Mycoplasma]MBN4083332.1 LemA family protein [Mycoplasma sp. CSL10137]MBN4084365.1 LemA family protein [Mycoplasma sp. CSL10166]MBU4692851.1 LemA family protein [Mycoplasma sp. CSL7491-lung]
MSNLFNNREYTAPQGLEPAVDNSVKKPESSILGKIFFWLVGLLIFSAIYYVVKTNMFKRMQNDVNEAASTIDTQLAKRADTLYKLVNSVKSFKDHETELYTSVTKMRSLTGTGNINDSVQLENLSNSVLGRLIAVRENYPELKSSDLYKELMEQSAYLEREISAARRLYNSRVNEFNSSIFTWPNNVISSTMKLVTLPLFQASQKQREDVSFDNL